MGFKKIFNGRYFISLFYFSFSDYSFIRGDEILILILLEEVNLSNFFKRKREEEED